VKILFSYDVPVAALLQNGEIVVSNVDYSPTTSGHINEFIGSYRRTYVEQAEIDALFEG